MLEIADCPVDSFCAWAILDIAPNKVQAAATFAPVDRNSLLPDGLSAVIETPFLDGTNRPDHVQTIWEIIKLRDG